MASLPVVRSTVTGPDEYRRAAGFRRSEAGLSPAPIREGSPESGNATPASGMISRSQDASWLPAGWLKVISANPDTILARNGDQGLKLYDALLDDDTAMSTLQQRRLAITSKDWEVTPGDDKDPRSVQAAEDFRKMLDEVGFDRVTGLLHYAIWFGYGVGEFIYTTKDTPNGPRIWLQDIVVPDRRWFGFTHEGELRYTAEMASTEGEQLPDNKFMSIRSGGTHDFAFYGLGLAHWCYFPIFFKRSALKFWALYLEKFGMPTVAVEFLNSEKDDDEKKMAYLQAAVAIGQDRAVLLPEGTISGERLKLIEAERTGAGGSSYKEFVEAQDEALMRIVLGQPGTSKGVSSGLNSDQASEHSDVKAEIIKADSDLISEAFNRTAPVWLTRWNYGEDVAPPKVFRILDDPEDLDSIADRDIKLKQLGLTRTEDSAKAVYGEGYDYTPPPTAEEQQANAIALATATAGAKAAPGKPASNDNAAKGKAKAAAFAAEFGIEDEAPLYVSRKLLNPKDVLAWAAKAGIGGLVPAADMHVTILNSREAVDWFKMGETWIDSDGKGGLTIKEGGPRAVVQFSKGALVLRFASSDLTYRHESMIERGASSDYPEYKPHITISYDPGEIDLDTIEPYQGELRFGPEIFEALNATPADPMLLNFSASEDEAIDRLIAALVEDTNPVFAAIAENLRDNLQGVTTLEGARVACLAAFEALPVARLAELTGLPMLAERAAAVAGADGKVTA